MDSPAPAPGSPAPTEELGAVHKEQNVRQQPQEEGAKVSSTQEPYPGRTEAGQLVQTSQVEVRTGLVWLRTCVNNSCRHYPSVKFCTKSILNH